MGLRSPVLSVWDHGSTRIQLCCHFHKARLWVLFRGAGEGLCVLDLPVAGSARERPHAAGPRVPVGGWFCSVFSGLPAEEEEGDLSVLWFFPYTPTTPCTNPPYALAQGAPELGGVHEAGSLENRHKTGGTSGFQGLITPSLEGAGFSLSHVSSGESGSALHTLDAQEMFEWTPE